MSEPKDIPEVQIPDPCGCETKHPLERDGTSQAQRLLAALDPKSVSVDERTLSDLLLFARNYARLLNYYKPDKTTIVTDGDWEVFLKKDISTLVAIVSETDTKDLRKSFYSVLVTLRNSKNVSTDEINYLLGIFKDMLSDLNTWFTDCDTTTLFSKDMNVYFQSMILDGYLKLVAFEQLTAQNVLTGFSFNGDWKKLVDGSIAVIDPSLYTGASQLDKNKSAANTLQSVFEKFIATLQIIVNRTPVYLAKSIEEYPYHKSHMGLFITFLELFAYAQKHANGITERHLNFFYQDVLQLTPKKAIADKVHVIFELAKNATEKYKVAEDTMLRAGKDGKGVDLLYGTDEDIILNKATVAQFKNLTIEKYTIPQNGTSPFTDATITTTGVYASPIANSTDGNGLALDKIVPQWNAFGSPQQGKTRVDHTMPDGRVGFAISSPQLFLSEGLRTVHVVITFKDAIDFTNSGIEVADLENTKYYRVGLTTLKEWTKPTSTKIKYSTVAGVTTLEFTFTITEKQAAITAYDPKVHLGTFSTPNPIIKIELVNFVHTKLAKPFASSYFKNLYPVLSTVIFKGLDMNVTAEKMQSLVLHNEFSKIDPSKPFMPFGQQPIIGSPFYVGSNEIFFKSIKTLNLDIDWHGSPKSFKDYYANYDYTAYVGGKATPITPAFENNEVKANFLVLHRSKWVHGSSAPSDVFTTISASDTNDNNQLFSISDAQKHVQLKFTNLLSTRANAADVFNDKILGSTRGFLQLTLKGTSFLHDIYPIALAKQAIAGAKDGLPLKPYTPVIKTFSAGYESDQHLNDENDQFYYLEPFGEQLLDEFPDDNTDPLIPLFPQFIAHTHDLEHGNIITDMRQTSMLFIGVENLVPQESLALLIQVVEDSGNHNALPPEISWCYLKKNNWINLTQQQVISDTSNGFLTSGIVELNIPDDATNDNTILPSGYHWLRASTVEQKESSSTALCKVLNIIAQAVQASFRDNGNDPMHLASSLAAKTIAKFVEPDPFVKSVSQPYGSFGGRMAEQGNDYYRRVSERLRHKGRGITMWDYERLVLENFPSIYKVKCISHTRDVTGNKECYSELAPGNVCLTVVSNLRNQNEVDKLKPTTSINTREEIQKFLNKRTSKFASITVINPDYELIQAKCNVTYLPEFEKDKGYYDNVLIEDIKKFLSPWAFDEGFDIVFGGKIHSSYIINFIEERPYVDFLTDFEMTKFKADDKGNYTISETAEELSASFAKTILVSADTHLINTNP